MRIVVASFVVFTACSFDPRAMGASDAASVDAASGDATAGDAIGTIDATPLACQTSYPLEHAGHRYKLGENLNWTDAETDCESEGGHLVVVDDQAENQFITGMVDVRGWIGASDHRVEGTFRWVTGSLVADGASFWRGSEPNNAATREDCAEIEASGEWNDGPCQAAKVYICECDGVAAAAPETWCVTGIDESCDICGDDCGAARCNGNQICVR